MMTIKEKARIAFEQDREVTVYFNADEELSGLIISYASYESDQITLRYKSPYVKHIPLQAVTDICFVGEVGDAKAEKPESVYEYIGRRLAHLRSAVEIRNIISQAQEKFGDVDNIAQPDPPADDVASEVWEVIHGEKGHYRLESTWNKRIALSDGIPIETAKTMAAANEMRDALEMVIKRSRLTRVMRNTRQSDTITVEFNPDGWRIITDAVNKADGGE